MRTQTFAHTVAAVAAIGMVLNSSCAPNKNRKINVSKNHSPLNHLVKSVKKVDGACGANQVPATSDAKTLQSDVEKLMSQGTPITADQLPVGVYTLTSVIGNIKAHNVKAAVTDPTGLSDNASTEYDFFKQSDIKLTDSKNDISEECAKIAMGGQVPSQDIGRSEAIDTFFVIDQQHHVKGDISATFNVRVNGIGIAPGQTSAVVRKQKLPANYSLMRRMMMAQKQDIDANGAYTNVIDATNRGLFDLRSTATVTLNKLSDTLYQIAINYNEYIKNSQVAPSRQIILTYAVALGTPTTTAGTSTPMTIPSKTTQAPVNASSASATAPVAPPPAASTAPQAPNQQPPQSQQDQDAQAAAAAAAQNPSQPATTVAPNDSTAPTDAAVAP